MPSTRSSARLGGSSANSSGPATSSSAPKASNGVKRQASTGTGKRGRPKKQKTIEQTMPDLEAEASADGDGKEADEGLGDAEMTDVADKVEAEAGQDGEQNDAAHSGEVELQDEKADASTSNGVQDSSKDEEPTAEAAAEGEPTDIEQPSVPQASGDEEKVAAAAGAAQDKPIEEKQDNTTITNGDHTTSDATTNGDVTKTDNTSNNHEAKTDSTTNGHKAKTDSTTNGHDSKSDTTTNGHDTKTDSTTNNGDAVEESKERSDAVPSNVLEKGIIYFLTRGRVGIEDPSGVQDIARSYMILRPLPTGAALGSGTLPDTSNNRLLAIPKKVLPVSGRDQFLTFVEKVGISLSDLKDDFMKGSTYDTKTTGVRHTPAVAPVGTGVYAITTTGRESHLAYIITLPKELGEVQKEMGIREQGSFVLSVKNPEQKGPAYASLPHGAEYPKEVMEEFAGRRWGQCRPVHLDYINAQVLLIGEDKEGLGKAGEADGRDEGKAGKETPAEEMEKLEEEDMARVEGLKGGEADAVFADLKLSGEEFSGLLTEW